MSRLTEYLQALSELPERCPPLQPLVRGYYRAMRWYLDGPRCFPQRQSGQAYRSPALATFWWALGWGCRLFTPAALLALPPATLLALHSMMMPDAILRRLILVLLALFCCDALLGALFWPSLRLWRECPARVCAGQPFQLVYRVENRRWLPAFSLHCDCALGLRAFVCLAAPVLPVLPGRSVRTVSGTYRVERRGKYRLGQLAATSSFPFALGRHSSLCRRHDELIVHPAYTPLRELTLPGGRKLQKSGLERVMKVSESMDFLGCRDYRAGDNPRHIHWRSSARRGALVVKEYQDEMLSRTALIVDTCLRRPSRPLSLRRGLKSFFAFFYGQGVLWPDDCVPELEAALALAASVADLLMEKECLIDLFAAGRQVRRLQCGRHVAGLETLLDILAEVEPEPRPGLHELRAEVLDEIGGLGSAVVILLGFDRERREFVEMLQERGVAVRLLVIGSGWEVPSGASLLSAADIRRGQVVRL